MFDSAEGFLIPMMIFAIPIVAIVGGITAGIVKTLGRQRLAELAQQERLAAIQRGLDPTKLPPLPGIAMDSDEMSALYLSPQDRDRRRAQGLMIGGIVTLAVGTGLASFLSIADRGDTSWAVGIIPMSIGAALLLCSWLIRPRDGQTNAGPRA